MILHSPTERGPVIASLTRHAAQRGVKLKRSSIPERLGLDFAWVRADGMWGGVQRKELKDFLASLDDGRLAREIAQMNAEVAMPMLVLEGRVQVANGMVMTGRRGGRDVTWGGLQRRLLTIASRGVQVMFTSEGAQTGEFLVEAWEWSQRDDHMTGSTRPGPSEDWGEPTNRDWQVHMLCGLDGVGKVTAEAIIDGLGRCPIRVDATEEELMSVKGVGKVTARRILKINELSSGDGERGDG